MSSRCGCCGAAHWPEPGQCYTQAYCTCGALECAWCERTDPHRLTCPKAPATYGTKEVDALLDYITALYELDTEIGQLGSAVQKSSSRWK